MGFPGGSLVKNLPAMQKTPDRSLGQKKVPGEGNGNPLQYSCLGNPLELARLQPWGDKRLRHDLATEQQQINK